MKRIRTILLAISLSLGVSAHTWTTESVLREGTWVKIEVSENGVYRMTDSELRSAGLNPNELRIYGYGGAQLSMKLADRIIDDLCPVAYYRGDGYVLFYGRGINSWAYDGSRFGHTRNTYSQKGYYFLSDDAGEKRLLNTIPSYAETIATDIYTYTQLALHEQEQYNLVDVTGVSGGGRHWFGERLTQTANSLTVSLPTHDLTGGTMELTIRTGTYSSASTTLTATLGSQQVRATAAGISDNYNKGNISTLRLSCTPSGTGAQKVKLQAALSNATSYSYLDYMELAAEAKLTLSSGYQAIQTSRNYQSTTPLRYHLAGQAQIWDVTSADSVQRVAAQTDGDSTIWIGSNQNGIHYYVAVNPSGSGFLSPTVVGKVKNQNIHGLKDIELVILTPKEFLSQAEEIASLHRDRDGYSVAVVTDQQCYNEFSSGTPDATAYRRLMKMLYDREETKPRWLLLFGDGSFDNRGILSNSGNKNLLSYEADNSTNEVNAYTCDAYFGWLNNNTTIDDGGQDMMIGVGRLPVSTTDQADEMVAKLQHYYADAMQVGAWHQKLLFMADDGDYGRHLTGVEQAAKPLMSKVPQYNEEKIYLSAEVQQSGSTGETYPAAQSRLHNLLADGVLTFDYCGHGSIHTITSENTLTEKYIASMENVHMGLWTMATCDVGHWDAGEQSWGESAILNPAGGAIAVFAASRTVYESQNEMLNKYLYDTLFEAGKTREQLPTIGEAVQYARNAYSGDQNKLAYNLLGDPAIRLSYPEDYHVETLQRPDTMRALSTNTVYGHIVDANGAEVSDYNGSVRMSVYDKRQTVKTVDNDAAGSDTLTFQKYSIQLFSGRAIVKDGRFELSFKIGKDIRYEYGLGRITYYTLDSTTLYEAVGYDESVIVGGSSGDTLSDTMGPDIDMYLNAPAFRSGSYTTSTPRLYVNLYDEDGINTSGVAIGHDIQLTIDNDPNQIYILNDEYVADEGSYESGSIRYLLGPLSNGYHTLSLRAWDLMNNSSTETLDFVVCDELEPQIYAVSFSPGSLRPDEGFTVTIQHDRPDEAVSAQVELFNIQGMKVYSNETSTTAGSAEITISCPAAGLVHGLYIYRICIKTKNSNDTSVSGKIMCL